MPKIRIEIFFRYGSAALGPIALSTLMARNAELSETRNKNAVLIVAG
jgi:hypothetical protein